AAWFGGTPTQVSGPTGPMTVVSAAIIATAIETSGSMDTAMGTIIATFMLAGVIQLVLGLLKAELYIRYIPYPVVSGFISGIGMLLIVLQIFPFLGHTSPQRIVDIFAGIPDVLNQINYASVGLAMATITVIYLFSITTKIIPGTFAALILLTIMSTILGLDVTVIGNITAGFPEFKIGNLFAINQLELSNIILPAFTLAILGAIDSLLTSAVADNKTQTQHNNNKELIGQGLGNMVSAAIGGLPGAGATMRTVVNINAGGRTRMSGVIHSISLLIVLLGASTYARLIPLPVLAGILVTVGIGIIDYKGIKHVFHIPKADAVIMLVVLTMTVFVDLLQAVAIGMVMASILFMKKMSDIAEDKSVVGSIEAFAREKAWEDETNLSDEIQKKVFIKHFDGPIFFGFANKFLTMTQSLPEVDVVIMRMKRVPYIDQSGIYAIEDAVMALQEKNVLILLTGLQDQPRDMLLKVSLIPNLIPEENLYDDFHSAIKALRTGNISFL
ncbi:MAG: SulP family inorganic anion transporter, partial [Thiotrichaceae bacterium]|nr:SulP family inorganic anion transporter [Thiotrichaceae bacterium]